MTPEQFADLLARDGGPPRSRPDSRPPLVYGAYTRICRLAMFANLSTPRRARDIVYKRVRNFVPALALDSMDAAYTLTAIGSWYG